MQATRWHSWTICAAGSRTACNSPRTVTSAYLNAVEEAFGADIDYGMLVKLYGGDAAISRAPLQPLGMHRRS